MTYTVEFKMTKSGINALDFEKVAHTFLFKNKEDADRKVKEILAERKASSTDAKVEVIKGTVRDNYADWYIARANDYNVKW